MIRDFTFIDDIAQGSIQCLDKTPKAEECPNQVPFRIYNIGCSNPVKLMDFIHEIEMAVGKKAEMIMKPMQPGDVYMTNADTTKLETEIGYKPKVNLHEGITRFIEWYQSDKNPLK
jgi:UDP-glucuronate 4-epimerase